ncbi:hypothetical protein N6L27_03505 [Leisingera sp. SS27]|uniref:hypothetical protein n=1 Tax=Leisingera sp. SS27 TaxID=2979462 RepID=UPI00233087BB|nr:hypothetical protein [Leisingera sp. SS27]MDC0657057.1 hypothetical protein [Leisingera sp. SS27]
MEAEADIMLEEQAPEQAQVSPEEFVAFAVQSQNLAAEISEEKLREIAQQVLRDYHLDKDSMSEWFQKMERGIKLASLVKEDKSYPFNGAANVKYPLVTSAALQFNARAYPAIVPPDQVVKAKVWGNDQGGLKAARALRVSTFMSYQLSGPIEEWEEETDNLLVQLPIVGTMVRKWWYDPAASRARCRLVDPGKFIVNDKVKNLNDAPRCSEELPLYPVEIEQRVRSGSFVEFEFTEDPEDAQGQQEFVEQHTRLDLDKDGYPEPYVVTVHVETQTVVRLVADFRETDVQFTTEERPVEVAVPVQDPVTGETVIATATQVEEYATGIRSIKRGSYFVAFKFLPSLDGGFHGTGLGLLLGDISETINSIINMLLDAGHYASLGGGFIGAEFRMKGGAQRHRPGEWKMVQSSGQAVRESIVPMTFPGPDATLFQMLGMMIDAGRELASVQDVMTGEAPRQNQTATTTIALIEQGMMVFTAAYKRIFRALKSEYSLLAGVNAETITPEEYNAFLDEERPADPAEDFNLSDMNIQPVADPRSVTKMQQAAKAQMLFEWAQAGIVDQGEALSRMSEAMDIEDVESLMPQPDPMQQQMGMMQMQAAQADLALKMADVELKLAQVEETRSQVIENITRAENDTTRVQLEAKRNRMDALFKTLEEDRARLETAIRGFGSLERASGNGVAAGGNAPGMQAPPFGDGGGLPVGPAMGRGGPQGFALG